MQLSKITSAFLLVLGAAALAVPNDVTPTPSEVVASGANVTPIVSSSTSSSMSTTSSPAASTTSSSMSTSSSPAASTTSSGFLTISSAASNTSMLSHHHANDTAVERISSFQPACFDGITVYECQYRYLPFYCDDNGRLHTAAPPHTPCGFGMPGTHCRCVRT